MTRWETIRLVMSEPAFLFLLFLAFAGTLSLLLASTT